MIFCVVGGANVLAHLDKYLGRVQVLIAVLKSVDMGKMRYLVGESRPLRAIKEPSSRHRQ